MSSLSMFWDQLSALTKSELGIIQLMSYFMIANGILAFISLQITKSPYGRYSSNVWGPGLNARVAWLVQELPSLFVPLYCIISLKGNQLQDLTNELLLGLFCIHYFQRALIYPLLIKGGKPTPVIPFLLAVVFCLYNGYMQGRYLTQYAAYPQSWTSQPNFIIGIVMFVFGMVINIHSDHVLRNLRKPGESGYKIPRGGAFELISGANFFGECLEWWGFALASWSLPALAFAFFTTANLGPRAIHHHQWYLEKFKGEYPAGRKALIPYIL